MNPKPRTNHQRYLEVLRSMTGEQRLIKAFEMSAFTKAIFIDGNGQGLANALSAIRPVEFHASPGGGTSLILLSAP